MCVSRKPGWMQLLAAALFISIVTACSIKTTATPTEIELATETDEAPISPSLPAETPPVPDAVLPTEDSRWVIAAEDGIYAVKPDGSDLKKLSDQIIYPIMMGPFVEGAPSGGHLAFSELSRVSDNLYLLSLSSGETKVVASEYV